MIYDVDIPCRACISNIDQHQFPFIELVIYIAHKSWLVLYTIIFTRSIHNSAAYNSTPNATPATARRPALPAFNEPAALVFVAGGVVVAVEPPVEEAVGDTVAVPVGWELLLLARDSLYLPTMNSAASEV
jgi:hypothetical protein